MATLGKNTASAVALVNNPDALYAAALHSLGANPMAVALLSPMSKALFTEVYGTVKGLASGEISSMTSLILSGASAILPSGAVTTLQALGAVVGEIVSEVAPYLAMVVDNVIEIASFKSKFSAPDIAANEAVTERMLSRPIQGTAGGKGGYAVTPADIFAPMLAENTFELNGRTMYVDPWSQMLYPDPWPYSSLGLCLAALTENNGSPIVAGGDGMANLAQMVAITPYGDWTGGDSTIRHHSAAWLLMPSRFNAYMDVLASPRAPNAGIPHETQNTMKLLRLAMGSRASTENGDPSAILYAMWADLFLNAWNSGQMTGSFALFALSHIWGPKGWNDAAMDGYGTDIPGAKNNPFGFIDAHAALEGAGVEQWMPYVLQAASVAQSWAKTRGGGDPEEVLAHQAKTLEDLSLLPARVILKATQFNMTARTVMALLVARRDKEEAKRIVSLASLFGGKR